MVTLAQRGRGGPAATLVAAGVATVALALGATRLGSGAAATLLEVVLLGLIVGAVLVATALRPVSAVYLYVATLPFLAGIDRSTLIPLVRPNEAVLALVLVGATTGWIVRWTRTGTLPRPVLYPVDPPLAAFVVLATVWPVASEMLRGLTPTGADLAATLPMVKLAALYLLVRVTVRERRQIETLIRLIIWPAATVSVIAVLQTLGVTPVLQVLQTWWGSQDSPADLQERGTTTLGSPLATGDVLVIAAVILVCCAVRGLLGRRERIVAGALLVTGIVATGQVTAWISAAVAAAFLLAAFPRLRRGWWRVLVPLAVLATAGIPALAARLQETSSSGVPVSWLTRWDNLSHFYLPALGDFHFLLGVRPNSVLPAPETWRDVIYLESGYLELLWIGGIPLLLGFVWLSWAVLRTARDAAAGPDARGALGQALGISWWTLIVVSVLDAHLTLRGTGDLLFVLLAVAAGVYPGRALTTAGPATGPTPAAPGTGAGEDPAPPPPRSPSATATALRRGTDVVVASLALVVLAVPLLVIAAAVRLSSPGPVLMRQRRVGLDRRSFVLLKFRTMRTGGSDAALRELIAAELRGEDTRVDGSTKLADPRITRVGGALRRSSLDELPQLVNVLHGDMTLVGPRPCLEWEAPMFPAEYAGRFSVLPGLTGLWQVEGRSTLGTLDMLRLDLDYLHGRGLRQDLGILLRTVPVLIRGEGAR
ncbi:sugar transferase [Actinomycetospora endophytica]|uniref:Sugar transferase n=1 Tax=Actinomycetospora endophytica TaxID=2291215 RepID=A0ABS8PFN6_9PSEU|nr:sugar transferase [Actinomycetospora endophytica]MCD2195819.1 sugar transferase [Actinomycetospora endophytica]